jgi:arabinan endo-1,5-alpha-L-arabinosidase
MNVKLRGTSILSIIFLFPTLSSGHPSAHPAEAISVAGNAEFVHDPSIIHEGDTWYVFATTSGPDRDGEIPVRCSNDLREWKQCGHVFDSIPEWIKKESPATKELWAPDISYFEGEFHLYYAFSVFGKNTSGIALATNKTLDPHSPGFHWEDRGLVLRSVLSDNYNAIDPNLILDHRGAYWSGQVGANSECGSVVACIEHATELCEHAERKVHRDQGACAKLHST